MATAWFAEATTVLHGTKRQEYDHNAKGKSRTRPRASDGKQVQVANFRRVDLGSKGVITCFDCGKRRASAWASASCAPVATEASCTCIELEPSLNSVSTLVENPARQKPSWVFPNPTSRHPRPIGCSLGLLVVRFMGEGVAWLRSREVENTECGRIQRVAHTTGPVKPASWDRIIVQTHQKAKAWSSTPQKQGPGTVTCYPARTCGLGRGMRTKPIVHGHFYLAGNVGIT